MGWRVLVAVSLTFVLLTYGTPSVFSQSSIPIFSPRGSAPVLSPTQEWEGTKIVSVSVLFDEGEFKAWYSAGTIQEGAYMTSIGYATSSDGVTWTKYDENPVFTPSGGASFDSVSVAFPSVVKSGSQYLMYYRGWDGSQSTIGLATSPNGVSWTRYSGTYTRILGNNPSVIFLNNEWRMYYRNGISTTSRISVATSSDGFTWSTLETDIVKIPAGFVDAYAPTVMFSDGVFSMWFDAGTGTGSGNQLFYASSTDGLEWTVYPDNPLPGVSDPGYPAAITAGNTTYLWYAGDFPNLNIYLATTISPIPEFGTGSALILTSITLLLMLDLSIRRRRGRAA
jgi:hypothetical protein